MKNEPRRHHYIPQFILKHFCYDEKHLCYFDKQLGKTVIKEPRDIFMQEHLYRDEENFPNNPTKIEKDLSVFESEVAQILQPKFFENDEIKISFEENEKLKLFFAIMGFRSPNSGKDSYTDREWKKDLDELAKCRSLQDVFSNENISDTTKLLMQRDCNNVIGKYFTVVKTAENKEFVLGDCYPICVWGYVGSLRLNMYDIYPILPERAILFACNGVDGTSSDVLNFRPCLLSKPRVDNDNEIITIRAKKIYDEEVSYLNEMIKKEAIGGYIIP